MNVWGQKGKENNYQYRSEEQERNHERSREQQTGKEEKQKENNCFRKHSKKITKYS